MADWSFRYRFKLGARMSIATDASECVLSNPGAPQRIVLRSVAIGGDMATPISTQRNLVLRGSGFTSPDEAHSEATRWLNALLLGFAANNLGADFGLRDPESSMQVEDPEQYATEEHPVVLPDVHSLIIFETEPPPLFVKIDGGDVTVHKSVPYLLEAVKLAYADQSEVTQRNLRAFMMYSSSFGMAPDARLVTLVSAVEVLVDPTPRMPTARAYVERWIKTVNESELPAAEKYSLRGSLQNLLNQSIGQTIAAHAAILGGQTYLGQSPPAFLKRCYTLRSQLVHGTSLPDWAEVSLRGAELERLVGDLISSSLLDAFDAEPAQTYVAIQIAPDWNGDPAVIPFVPVAHVGGTPDEDNPDRPSD